MKIDDLEFEPLIEEETIAKRINLLAVELNADYAGKTPIFIGVLNGSFLFVADLVKHITIPCEVTFTKLASYYGGTTSSRKIREDIDLSTDISGRHIVIIEDIVDTGNTLAYLIEKLKLKNPASISVCAMLVKPGKLETSVEELRYVGFEIENEFVVGYGLDYKELGRNLRDIYRLTSTTDEV
ncbi:hypoxanthine phosphoribosyltransferase [Mucilaginibacter sp. Bleaf8]|uniref:hypoxanthine phosphoribosyltransferase n=1 Tax=Mucilaginibacter sp. Bleaf8 TaxID=2834430 RepID=UPI001BD0F023|nr:hypoxanthine phosphoribosyltransferase [Mucilaginibacter sp. Bleaf8]MBS7565905.1 hypoxanthine phosphoribosyltransferase [Mucilaginibacter sp. Bleaf8]